MSSAVLELIYRDIARDMLEVEAEIRAVLESPVPDIASLLEVSGRYGGKRMRPALVFLVARESGGVCEGHARLGAVVELIHLATLVHDDVIDVATMRRRQETVNVRHGNYEAVLLGDIIFSRAIHLLARLGNRRALLALTQAVSTVCEGEILQNRHRQDPDLTETTYYTIISGKTAELYAAATGLAAHLAGAADNVVEAFALCGLKLGIAFQIIDDCLDVAGEEAQVGKSLGTDLRNGKMTLPLLILREQADEATKALLRRVILGQEDAGGVALLNDALRSSGALEEAVKRAEAHVAEGLLAVRSACGRDSLALAAVGRYVLERKL